MHRWADKSLSLISFSNGHGGINSDHSPFDAMVNVVLSGWVQAGLEDQERGFEVGQKGGLGEKRWEMLRFDLSRDIRWVLGT